MRRFQFIHLAIAIALATTLAGTLAAQNANTPPNTPPVLQAFNIERVLTITNILTTLTPNIPPTILAGVQSGALELRESIGFTPTNQTLTINVFAVQAGSPIPTAANPGLSSNTFTIATMGVDKIYSSVIPKPSLMFVGTMSSNPEASPYGNVTGAPAALSIGYTADTPPKVANVVLLIAGKAVEYSPDAQGTLTFVQPPAPPGPSTAPVIVISSPTTVFGGQADLDASKSTSPNLPLTFSWKVLAGSADIAHATSGLALAYLTGGRGFYIFQVTVTDSKGNSATQKLTLTAD